MRFAVVGDPVDHSRSPAIHNAAFEALGIDAFFEFWRVPKEGFSDVEKALRSGHFDGVSVTMPHKHNAFESADTLSERARRTGAVNTLVRQDGLLFGDNTDVSGVLHALDSVESSNDAPVLLLGNGGAAAAALLAVEGRDVAIAGRNGTTSHALVDRVGVKADVVAWGTWIQSATVINATPLGMRGEPLPEGVTERAGALVDMTYGSTRSPAFADALAIGIPASDGLTMLVGQAVGAFELFTGRQASSFTMERAARS